jgi:hypothetical protein
LKEVAFRFPLAHHLVLGVMLIVIIRAFPGGLVACITSAWTWVRMAVTSRQHPGAVAVAIGEIGLGVGCVSRAD